MLEVDTSDCNDCGSCMDICPSVFKKNPETGLIEVVELDSYPETEIQDAINCCPRGCIRWKPDKTHKHVNGLAAQN